MMRDDLLREFATIERSIQAQSNFMVIVESAISLTLIAFLDYTTGTEVRFSIFYVIPVAAVTWRISRKAGILTASASAVMWAFADYYGRPEVGMWIVLWNVLVGLSLLTLVAFLISRVKRLTGLLPTCAWCRRVRTDTGEWVQMETYIAEHSNASFTHGICPACTTQFDPHATPLHQSERMAP